MWQSIEILATSICAIRVRGFGGSFTMRKFR
jgi:hypothetical protein